MRKQTQFTRAFTLVELLIVISIIAALMALLFPAAQTAFRKSKSAKAKATLLSIASALKAFDREYSGWPTGASSTPQDLSTNLFSNARGIVFLDIPSKDIDSSGKFLDPWKNPYQVAFTVSGPLATCAGINNNGEVAVWSWGPDGVCGTSDDITSW